MQELNYSCPKCGNNEYDISEMRATGGTLSKIFDVQKQHFGEHFRLFYKLNIHQRTIKFDLITSSSSSSIILMPKLRLGRVWFLPYRFLNDIAKLQLDDERPSLAFESTAHLVNRSKEKPGNKKEQCAFTTMRHRIQF